MKLDIQLFASGTITGTSTASGGRCRILWEEGTGSTSTNTSPVTATFQIRKDGSSSTTGTFSGSITINGTKTSISKKFSPYNWGTWATVGSATVNVKHNTDGTKSITIKGSVSNTGTSMAGTYSASGTAVLSTLHKAPVINNWTMQETNSKLTNIGLDNGVFVKNISRVRASINDATYYDDASHSKTILYREIFYEYQPYMELTEEYSTFTPTSVVSSTTLRARIQDTLGGISDLSSFGYNYTVIDYNPVTINGSVKRNGQTSGLVTLNCNGTYYNGVVGNIDHSLSTYKPTISYKFYEVGHEEDAITGLVPSSNITTSNGTFNVSNLEIGSTNPNASNYFNYEKAYRVVIAVQDDYIDGNNNQYYFSSATTKELSISVGEATFTEFKDRVDFKKITIKNEPIITTETYVLTTGNVSSGGTKDITYTISKTGYTPIGVMGYSCGGTNSSFINIYGLRIISDTQAQATIRNTGSSALVNNNTAIRIYVAYIRN